MKYTVSVVIPSKNRKHLLGAAIQSVKNQTIDILEIIVVDDGSTDGTEEYLEKKFPDVKVIRLNISINAAKARNIGAKHSIGDYIAFLDSDDIWYPNHLDDKLKCIDNYNASAAFGPFDLQKDGKLTTVKFKFKHLGGGNLEEKLFAWKRFDARTSTFVFKRESFLSCLFDENLSKHQDWDLAINFDKRFKLVCSTSTTALLITHQSNERLSNNLHHNSTVYFIQKNKNKISANSMFRFILKRILHYQKTKQLSKYKMIYLDLIKDNFTQLSIENKILYILLKKHCLNLALLHTIKSKFSLLE